MNSSADLVARASSGDQEAFRLIFERYSRPVISFVYDLVGDRGLAEELTQETFVRAFRGLGAMRQETRLSTWLFGIARNVARESMRARARDSRHVDLDDSSVLDLSDQGPAPVSQLLSKELNDLILRSLASLDDDKRLVFTLKVFQQFTRAEVYNLRRTHEFSGYPVYWTGRVGNEESLNYLKSFIDSASPEINRLADRATFAVALHDDARVESILTDMIRRPITEPVRSRAIYWLGFTPESQSKNTLLAEIVRSPQESGAVRQQAMSALAMSRAAATLPLLENLFETMTARELKRRALSGIARNDNSDGAATYLIRIAETEKELELRKSAISSLGRIAGEKSLGALTNTLDSSPETEIQKQAVIAIGRRPKDEAIPILIRTARNHPKMQVRKVAIQVLGKTGDERAVAFFRELLGK